MAQLPPVPRGTPLIKSVTDRLVHFVWDNWFQQIHDLFAKTASVASAVRVTGQSASIGATALNMNALSAGQYRTTYALDVTRAAAVSSSLAFGLSWIYNGVTRTFTGATISNGATSATQGSVVPMNVDANTTVSYSTTYASSGSPSMTYALTVTLEQMP